MKKQLFALVGLGLLLTAASAYAQMPLVKVNVPFNFIANKSVMPAGEYTIDTLITSSNSLLIHSTTLKTGDIVLSNPCESRDAASQSKLVFHRYGDRYFLSQIWVQGETIGRQLPRTRREVEVAKDYAVANVTLVAQAH
jgi:hypothetical protein